MPVPRDFDIFSPFTVRCPWMCTYSGSFSFATFSTAGQKRQWK